MHLWLKAMNTAWFTHRGWDYDYVNAPDLQRDQYKKTVKDANFDLRKTILLQTVNQVFDFGLLSNKLLGYDEKCNSFAAFVYYVHILGDFEEVYQKEGGHNVFGMIPLVKGRSEYGLIEEFEKHLTVLFSDQQNGGYSRTYNSLMTELKLLKDDVNRIYTSDTELSNDYEKYHEYLGYAHKLLDILKEYVPLLLKNETFFQKVFYKNRID